jgi:hypothetical protein
MQSKGFSFYSWGQVFIIMLILAGNFKNPHPPKKKLTEKLDQHRI